MSGLSLRSNNCPPLTYPKVSSTPPRGKENLFPHAVSVTTQKDNNDPSTSSGVNFKTISLTDAPMELKPKVINPLFKNKSLNEIPIPKGNTAYSKAKRAEYIERDLAKAEKFYKIAIRCHERLDSAIKDLATVLHQQGKTEEACKFLEQYRDLYQGDKVKYENLLTNLRKQIVPSGNCLNRTLVLFDYPSYFGQKDIRNLFSNNSRILRIDFKEVVEVREDAPTSQNCSKSSNKLGNFCLIDFASYSAARKTLETLKDPNHYQLYWMSIYGKIAGKAELIKSNTEKTEEQDSHQNENVLVELQVNTSENKNEISSNQLNLLLSEDHQEEEAKQNVYEGEDIIKKDFPMDETKQKTISSEEINQNHQFPEVCWKHCVFLSTSENPSKDEPLLPQQAMNVQEEILVHYSIFKVFENEEKIADNLFWKRLLKKTNQTVFQNPIKNQPSLWEKIERKEHEIRTLINDDSSFIQNLLNRPSTETIPLDEKLLKSDDEAYQSFFSSPEFQLIYPTSQNRNKKIECERATSFQATPPNFTPTNTLNNPNNTRNISFPSQFNQSFVVQNPFNHFPANRISFGQNSLFFRTNQARMIPQNF